APVRAVAGPPELVAVALLPVAPGVAAVRGLEPRRRLDPRLGDELAAVPAPFLEVELPELGDVLGPHAQAVAAEGDPLRALAPVRVVDPQGLEQPGAEVVEHRL